MNGLIIRSGDVFSNLTASVCKVYRNFYKEEPDYTDENFDQRLKHIFKSEELWATLKEKCEVMDVFRELSCDTTFVFLVNDDDDIRACQEIWIDSLGITSIYMTEPALNSCDFYGNWVDISVGESGEFVIREFYEEEEERTSDITRLYMYF